MQKYNELRGKFGRVIVSVEGYFVERFINLCKKELIEIWNIKNINGANIEFEIEITNFKKLKKIAKISKCKIKIKEKKGIYFFLHKYRKRKVFAICSLLCFFSVLYLSTLIWNIEIEGNTSVDKKEIIQALNESGISKGKCRYFIKPQKSIKYIRAKLTKIVWVTINVRGTNIEVKVKERGEEVELEDSDVYKHIIAKKDGVITKIIAENGTKMLKQGDYIEKGQIAICGAVQGNKTTMTLLVKARGIVRANVKYEESYEIENEKIDKIYDGKKYFLLGFGINNKEFILNYLIKAKKYDITKSEYSISILKCKFFMSTYTARSYTEKNYELTEDMQKKILNQKIDEKINSQLINETTLVEKKITYEKKENKLVANVKYILNEDIAESEIFNNLEEGV